MRWPWQREPAKNEEAQERIEELNVRHRKALKRAVVQVRSVLSGAADDIEKLIVDDYDRADVERRKGVS